jgi:hypothetical protein
MDIREQRLDILKQVENGEMSLAEAERWLAALDKIKNKALEAAQPSGTLSAEVPVEPVPEMVEPALVERVEPPAMTPEVTSPPVVIDIPAGEAENKPVEEPRSPAWRGLWLLVFLPGLLLAVAAVSWMNNGLQAAGLGWGFWLSFIPLAIGVMLMWLGWEIRLARWLYLHIQQRPGAHPREIMLSFPLPMGLISWGVRRFGRFNSRIRGQEMGDFLEEVDQAIATDGAMHVLVDDPDGSKVEIWIDGPQNR